MCDLDLVGAKSDGIALTNDTEAVWSHTASVKVPSTQFFMLQQAVKDLENL